MLVYHIADQQAWESALEDDEYAPPSLASEGFIHCSTQDQLLETAQRHYDQAPEPLIVLHIVDKRVRQLLKWEEPYPGQKFPHIYGPLPLEAVEDITALVRDDDGKWTWDTDHGI